MNKAIILAGGVGSRFSSEMLKQFLSLNGKTLIGYVIESCIFSRSVESISIVCPKGYEEVMERTVKDLGISAEKNIKILVGGESRMESTVIGFCSINLQAEDTVILLEANRPFVCAEDIDKIYSDFLKEKAECAFYFSQMNESLFFRRENGTVSWLDKSKHGLSQTPYILSYAAVKGILESMTNKIYSDCEDILSYLPILMKQHQVKSSFYNLKITYPEDLVFGECLMKKNGK